MKSEIVAVHDSGGVTRATLLLDCERGCQIPVRQGEARMGASKVWGWDGNVATPSVTPSIACTVCGFHKTFTNGVWQ